MFSETTESPLSSTSVNKLGGADAAEIIRIFRKGNASPVTDVLTVFSGLRAQRRTDSSKPPWKGKVIVVKRFAGSLRNAK